MKSEDIKNRVWTEHERQTLHRLAKRQAVGDDTHIDVANIPRLSKVQLVQMTRFRERRSKVAVSLRLDPTVLDWLKSKGDGHLTLINDILLNLMEAEQSTRADR